MIHIHTLPLGVYQTNCYLVWGDGADSCVVIDPAFSADEILAFTEEKGLETLYKQDSPFSIQCDSFGYTEATLSYYVSSYGGSAGHSISRSEFEKNY